MGRIEGRIMCASHLRASSMVVLSAVVLLPPRPAAAAGALETVAQGATQSLVLAPGPSVVVAAPLASEAPAPKGDELALRIAALIAGRLGTAARFEPQTARLAAARAFAGRASALVYVESEIAKGDLRTTVDVYRPIANAWDRVRNPTPSPYGHGFASTKIDAEVRGFLAPLLLEQASIDRARHDEGEVLAAACGDLDGDGGNELALISRSRVALGRIHRGRFVPEKVALWSALAPQLSVPMREPLASAVVTSEALDVGTTDYGGVQLTPDLGKGATLFGLPAWGGDGVVCLRPEPSAGAFDGAPVDCAMSREPHPKMAVPAPRFDAFGATSVVDSRGDARSVLVVREPSGKLRIKAGDAVTVAEGPFGAQIAVGDLDQDGVPEIVTSVDTLAATPTARPDDAIDIGTWNAEASEVRSRLRVPAPGGVRALAICPPEDHGEPALVAVVGNEVWLLRAAAAPSVPVAVGSGVVR